jgi:hypothetical protein
MSDVACVDCQLVGAAMATAAATILVCVTAQADMKPP